MSAEYFLESLFRSGIMLAVVAVVVGVLLRFSRCRSPQIHRLAWGFVILHGILWTRFPVELAVLKPVEKTVAIISEPAMDVAPIPAIEFVQQTSVEVFVPKTEPTPKPSLTLRALLPQILVAVWVVGFVGIVLVRTFGYFRLLILLRTATESEYRKTRLLLTDQIGPAIIRLWQGNTVLVPKTFWEEAPDAVRDGILKHELSHAEHHDGLKSFVFSTLAAVQWFNPAAWWAIKKFDEAAEWRCDGDAYGNEEQSVVRFAESMLLLHRTTDRYVGVVPAFRNRDLAERIRRLSERQFLPREKTMKQIVIVFLLAAIFCCGVFRIHLVAQNPPKEPGTERTRAVPGLVAPEMSAMNPGATASTPTPPARVDMKERNPLMSMLGASYSPSKTTITTDSSNQAEIIQAEIIQRVPMVYLTDSDKDVLTFENGQWTLANSNQEIVAPFSLRSRQPFRVEQDGDTVILKTESIRQIIGPGEFRRRRGDDVVDTIKLRENETATFDGKVWQFKNGWNFSFETSGTVEITCKSAVLMEGAVLATGKYVKVDQGGARILVGDSPETAQPLYVKR